MKRNLLPVLAILLLSFSLASQTTADSLDSKVVRILAIGNSFSEDALDYHFHQICHAAGKQVIVGNLYIGGCSLDRHWLNATTDSAEYRLRRIGLDGATITAQKVPLSHALASDTWDYISLQQASGSSGIYSTFSHLPELIDYVESHTYGHPTLVWHQTWAYSTGSKHGEFPKYNSNQQTMFNAICEACSRALADNPRLSIVVPSGTAVQNARKATGDYNLTRDGYHLSKLLGRYVASCAWFEAIFGEDVSDNSYVPQGLSPSEAAAGRRAAHEACRSLRGF